MFVRILESIPKFVSNGMEAPTNDGIDVPEWKCQQPLEPEGAPTLQIETIGIDLTKNVFQIHGADQRGKVVLRKQLRRDQVAPFFASLQPCLIGIEACSSRSPATSRSWMKRSNSMPRWSSWCCPVKDEAEYAIEQINAAPAPKLAANSQVPGMPKRILIIQAHPDASRPHLAHSLAAAYVKGAEGAGHTVRQIVLGTLDFPLLRSQQEWEEGSVPASLKPAQDDIGWAEHIVFFFPLWLGDMPALLKGFLEQVARPGFAIIREKGGNPWGNKGLTGRSARVVVTMGMPALVYRWYFRAHSIKSLQRNVLGFVGIAPVHETLIGLTGDMKPKEAAKWLEKLERLGAQSL